MPIRAYVELAEISGSETYLHVRYEGMLLVAQEDGVHGHAIGEIVTLYADPARLFVFDTHGSLVAAPRRAQDHLAAA